VFPCISLFAALLLTPTEAAEPFPFFEPVKPPRPVQVMVHRGLSVAAHENTRRAIEMCIEDYYEWVEIDVRLTKDGKHVVFNDNHLNGKSDSEGAVADHSLEQILSLDGGNWSASQVKNC
jgi:glycerophosphoryl diester phosphodiesterase